MKFATPLRTRLVFLVLAAVLPLFGLAVVGAQLASSKALGAAQQQLAYSAALVAASQARVAASARQILTAIATVPAVQNGNDGQCQQYLEHLNAQDLGYVNFGIVGLDGVLRCRAVGNDPPEFIGDRGYFQEAVARQGFVASGFLIGRASGKPAIVFAQPVLDRNTRTTAVAFVTLSLAEMATSFAAAALPSGMHFVVLDRQGTVLARDAGNSAVVGQTLDNALLLKAIETGVAGGFEGAGAAGAQQLYAYEPIGAAVRAPFFVAVSVDKAKVLAPSRQRLGLEYLALTLVALFGSWLAWTMGGRWIVKPVAAILAATKRLQAGQFDGRIVQAAGDDRTEFAHIASGLNRMADTLQQTCLAREAALAHSQAVHTRLLDAQRLSRIGFWQIDLATAALWCSDEAVAVVGLDRATFDGSYTSFLACIHPADRESYQTARDTAVKSGQPLAIDFRAVGKDGQVRWIHAFSRVDIGADGAASQSRSGGVQDITERKQAELAMARATALLQRTGSLAQVGGWELDVATMEPDWSDEILRIHGIEPLEQAGQFTFDEALRQYSADTRAALQAALAAAIRQATPWDMVAQLTTPGGQRKWVRCQGCALLEGGQVVRLAGVLQDITVQHEAQARARLLEICISRVNDIVMITEAEPLHEPGPRIVFVNDAFERLTGYSRAEALGKTPRILQGPKTNRAELKRIGAAMRAWQPARAELVNYTKSGTEFWNEFDIVPVANEAGWYTHWVAVERDVTARRLADQAFIDSEQRYRALFALAPVPMCVYDVETCGFLAVNQAAMTAYGYSLEEFLSMTIFDLRPPAERAYLRQWLAHPPPGKARWHDVRKDGSRFSVETASQAIQYAGRAARFVVVMDKTAQDQVEKNLQENLFTLQRAADAAQAITWQRTLEGTLQEIAEQARGVVGAHEAIVILHATGQAEGGDKSQPALPLQAVSVSEKYAARQPVLPTLVYGSMAAMVGTTGRAVRISRADSADHPQQPAADASGLADSVHPPAPGCLAVPLTGSNGKTIGLLQLSDKFVGDFTQQDEYVTLELGHLASAAIENSRLLEEVGQLNAGLEQKVVERTLALAQQEALFRALAEQAPQCVWTASPEGAGTYFNRTWFEMMGGELSDWSGYQWLRAIHPEDIASIKSQWQLAVAGQASYAGIRRVRSNGGGYRTMAYRASPVRGEQGDVAFWVGIDADITDIKATEAALRLSNQELEAFSYSVSHDLRSPLNTIDGFSRLLGKQLASRTELEVGVKSQHYLARIQAGVAQMGQLIEDLLSLSQVARAPLNTESVDLSAMVRSLLEDHQACHPDRVVAVQIADGLIAEVDARLVRVALENLLSNAWKFTAHSKAAMIQVGQTPDAAGMPVFFVRDNGAGFDMAYASRLFDPFQRLHAAVEFPGTGIGLATVSRIIKRHDGRIWAEAAPGSGATFFFTFPQVRRTV